MTILGFILTLFVGEARNAHQSYNHNPSNLSSTRVSNKKPNNTKRKHITHFRSTLTKKEGLCFFVRERMRYGGGRRRRMLLQPFLVMCATVTAVGLLIMALRPLDPRPGPVIKVDYARDSDEFLDFNSTGLDVGGGTRLTTTTFSPPTSRPCATVEEMGKDFENGFVVKEMFRVRRIIEQHFVLNGKTFVSCGFWFCFF